MTQSSPPLIERSFEEIVEEAKRRIPRYTNEWTDFNESDPGIVLVQLFAWLTEVMQWEINQVPARSYGTLLQLLDMQPEPAVPAEADITFQIAPNAVVGSIPGGAQIASAVAGPDGRPLLFETDRALEPVRYPVAEVRIYDAARDHLSAAINSVDGSEFLPFGSRALQGSALYLGFGPETGDATGTDAPVFPARLWLRIYKPDNAVDPAVRQVGAAPPPPPVRLIWEYRASSQADGWNRLRTFSDDTAGLTREGYVAIEGPSGIAATRLQPGDGVSRYWLRCRLDGGHYAGRTSPALSAIVANTVPARNLATVQAEILGVSDGRPDQRYTLQHGSVLADSLELDVIDGGTREAWRRTDALYAEGPDARVFVFDPARGEVRFGDDLNGRIPTTGARIQAARYRFGGGAAGNVRAGAIDAPQVNVPGIAGTTNLRRAVGGQDAQSEEALRQSAPEALRNKHRAVTADDYRVLAQAAGGVRAARALPFRNPNFPETPAPGALTVFILPDTYFGTSLRPSPPPVADADLVAHVARALEPSRMLTAEVYVASARFRVISLQAAVVVEPHLALGEIEEKCVEALNRLLVPPLDAPPREAHFGADLYPSSAVGALEDVPGVISAQLTGLAVDGVPQASLVAPIRVPDDTIIWGSAAHSVSATPGPFGDRSL